jgi:hypothetical protein
MEVRDGVMLKKESLGKPKNLKLLMEVSDSMIVG